MKAPALNRVQLIGRVYEQPARFEEAGVGFLRLLIEVDEHDEKGKFFSSYHVVVVREEETALKTAVGRGDVVFVEGRLNPYVVHVEGKADRQGFNVQGVDFFVLRRNQEHLKAVIPGNGEASDDVDQMPEIGADPKVVVSMFGDKDVDKEPPF
jgi:hypothetical protein